MSGAPAAASDRGDERGSRRAAPDRASGPFLDACRAARLRARHGARHLGEPHLPDARLQRGPERRRDGARDALRRLDPERDAAALGGAAAALARPDPDPRAAHRAVRRRRGAAGDASARRSAPARSSCSTPRAASSRRATSGRASSTTATTPTSRWRRPTPAPVFSIIENDDGAYSFHYARRVTQDDQLLGVVVVTVDLGLHEEGWRRARVKVVVTDTEDQVLLASEPNWRKQTLTNLLAAGPDASRVRQAIRDARAQHRRARLRLHRRHAAPASPRCRSGFRNWRLTYFATLEDVRARVNAILSLIIMVLALLLALAFYLLSRRTRAESRRIQRESEELRVLNRRLSRRDRRPPAGRDEPQGGRAEPRAGLQARRARPDVGRGQPRAEPAARGDEDLSRRRAAAADTAGGPRRRSPRSSASTT